MKLLQISNIVSTIIVFILNMMASMGMINNKTTGYLSDKLPNLFVPSGLTFSIWGLIYFLLFLFILEIKTNVFYTLEKKDPSKITFLFQGADF